MTTPAEMQPPGWGRRAAIADDRQPHQVRIFNTGNRLVWSCTCQRGSYGHTPLGQADGLTVDQILAAHQQHTARAA